MLELLHWDLGQTILQRLETCIISSLIFAIRIAGRQLIINNRANLIFCQIHHTNNQKFALLRRRKGRRGKEEEAKVFELFAIDTATFIFRGVQDDN